ncbi:MULTISPECIES: hypothetical protein [unclassified Frankia]|uniref:hypothetical protein n=1 Tax=unclassified Frankia TaxID=2632575 RepID=UPI002AD49035|nr:MULTISPECIES: hypothetical protein [unclassified Frankia]
MAFNGLQPASGPFFLAPGASVRLNMWYGNQGDDHGAQWIMAHPLSGEAPTELIVSDHSKILDYAIGCVEENGSPRACPGQDPYYRYGVTVTNRGTSGVRFNIQGGGNT